jgi:hypothetical protein
VRQTFYSKNERRRSSLLKAFPFLSILYLFQGCYASISFFPNRQKLKFFYRMLPQRQILVPPKTGQKLPAAFAKKSIPFYNGYAL